MLHNSSSIIQPKTLDLLKRICNDPTLNQFYLVGGTALALQMGHRLSIDLDMFSGDSFDEENLVKYLSEQYDFQLNALHEHTLLGNIQGIKVDFITHNYPLVEPVHFAESVRYLGLLDIGAMKLNAIARSGQRLKDFVDIHYLLTEHPLSALLEAYETKYSYSNKMIPLKALTYFDDLDPEIDPPHMIKKIKVTDIKERLTQAVKHPEKLFSE
jgi:hypothetical protein